MREMPFTKWKRQMIESAMPTKTPVCATFELTPRCNLDCKMCYIHNKNSNAMGEKELSTAEWKRIFDEAYDCGMMFATLTGGECLLRTDFKELYLHLWEKGIFLTVFTNGTMLSKEYIAFFKTYKPRKIQISLYGSSEEGYENVTGQRGFEKTVTSIRSLMACGIPVQIAVTASSYMKEDYVAILSFCNENGFPYRTSDMLLIENREEQGKEEQHLSTEEIVALSIDRAMLLGVAPSPAKELPPCGGLCEESPRGLVCNAGRTSAVVSWDGRMCLCTAIPISKASVLETSYAEAWERTKEAASEILLGAECVGCPYDKVCPKCPAMRLTGLNTGHCNPAVCELTRRLVAVGIKKLDEAEEAFCQE